MRGDLPDGGLNLAGGSRNQWLLVTGLFEINVNITSMTDWKDNEAIIRQLSIWRRFKHEAHFQDVI